VTANGPPLRFKGAHVEGLHDPLEFLTLLLLEAQLGC
jgi:hypothetical protein